MRHVNHPLTMPFASEAEREFNYAMVEMFDQVGKQTGYYATTS